MLSLTARARAFAFGTIFGSCVCVRSVCSRTILHGMGVGACVRAYGVPAVATSGAYARARAAACVYCIEIFITFVLRLTRPGGW